MVTTEHLFDVVERCTRRWDQRDIEGVLSSYSSGVVYREPGAGIACDGRDALRSYLLQYFATFDSRWIIKEQHRLEGQNAVVAFWEMIVWRPGAPESKLTTKGMDMLTIVGDEIVSDIVYFDRTQLQPLLKAKA